MKHRLTAILAGVATLAGIFAIAGTLLWWNAWGLLTLVTIAGAMTSRLIGRTVGLREERQSAAAHAPPWDAAIVRFLNAVLPGMIVAAAVDQRFHLLPAVANALALAAGILAILSLTLSYFAIKANPFFSSHIRIQRERGQRVMTSGPYRWIRHPGYLGAVIFNLAVPLVLGSWLPMPIAVITALTLLYRTAREDRILQHNLDGYTAYTEKVRYRLLPGLW